MTILMNPSSANWKAYAGGSNTCFKAITKGGPTPTQITDTSGRGNHGVFTTAPDVALVGDLWTYQFVSGSSEYVTVPDITELLGATAATWCAWVRKDGANIYQECVASDYSTGANEKKWRFGNGYTADWQASVGNGTTDANIAIASSFAAGWHFVWVRFTSSSATGLETGCDNSVATPVTTAAIAALGSTGHSHTYIGRREAVYSSITLGALTIWPSAISDAEIQKWRKSTQAMLGV